MDSNIVSALDRMTNHTLRAGGLPHPTGPNVGSNPSNSDALWPICDAKSHSPIEKIADQRARMSVGGLDFLSIRLVVLCAELGCLSAAAQACNISLSTASHRLTNLEKVFNTRFFRRHHLGLQPTQAGTVFSTHARAMLLAMYSAERQLQSLPAPNREDVARRLGVGKSQRG